MTRGDMLETLDTQTRKKKIYFYLLHCMNCMCVRYITLADFKDALEA